MAVVIGFDPANSGQQPEDFNGNPVPVGVWGDSNTGGGVFGTSGVLPSGTSIPIDPPAGVEGHGATGPGVVGRSLTDNGVVGESQEAVGIFARGLDNSGLLGVTFSSTDDAEGVLGSSTTGGNGVTGFVGDADGVLGSSVRGTGVHGVTRSGTGVRGESVGAQLDRPGPGVHGMSDVAAGVRGVSGSANGSEGTSFGTGSGVVGVNFSPDAGAGVTGRSVLGNGVEGFTFADIRQTATWPLCAAKA